VVLVLAAAGWGYFTLQNTLNQPLRITVADTLEVPPGSTPASVFAGLENRGVIERAAWVRRYWQWRMPDTILQVGEYRLEPGWPGGGRLAGLRCGEVARGSVTVGEGWNFSQFCDALAGAEGVQQTLPRDWSNEPVAAELELSEPHPEGLFFPDTYLYTL